MGECRYLILKHVTEYRFKTDAALRICDRPGGEGGGERAGLLRGCGIVEVQYLFLQMLQGGEGCQ